VELDKVDLDDLVVVADERVEDAADVGRVDRGIVDRTERATRSTVALEHQALALCNMSTSP